MSQPGRPSRSVLGARASADLVSAVQTGNLKLLRESLHNGANPDLVMETEWRPLMVASQGGHTELVK